MPDASGGVSARTPAVVAIRLSELTRKLAMYDAAATRRIGGYATLASRSYCGWRWQCQTDAGRRLGGQLQRTRQHVAQPRRGALVLVLVPGTHVEDEELPGRRRMSAAVLGLELRVLTHLREL